MRAAAAAEVLRTAENEVIRDVRIAWLNLNNAMEQLQTAEELVRQAGEASPYQRYSALAKRIYAAEGRLHALGIWHFSQIAAWTPDNVHWVGSYLSFPGRIDREQWIAQATQLAAGGETEFSRRVEHGDVAKSHDHGTAGQDNIADLSTIKPRH